MTPTIEGVVVAVRCPNCDARRAPEMDCYLCKNTGQTQTVVPLAVLRAELDETSEQDGKRGTSQRQSASPLTQNGATTHGKDESLAAANVAESQTRHVVHVGAGTRSAPNYTASLSNESEGSRAVDPKPGSAGQSDGAEPAESSLLDFTILHDSDCEVADHAVDVPWRIEDAYRCTCGLAGARETYRAARKAVAPGAK